MHAEPIPSILSGAYECCRISGNKMQAKGLRIRMEVRRVKGDRISMGYALDLHSDPVISIEKSKTSCLPLPAAG
jgi:hypothetical protein